MHTLHWISTEAESVQDAFDNIKTILEKSPEGGNVADWSDWHVVGGGRWNEVGDGYTDQSNMIVSYKDNAEKFKEVLSDIKKYRTTYLNRKLSSIDNAFEKLKVDIVDYISNGCDLPPKQEWDFSRYDIKDCIAMLGSEWTPESGFFDSQEYTSKIKYLEERLDNSDKAALQYLVPVDFHF